MKLSLFCFVSELYQLPWDLFSPENSPISGSSTPSTASVATCPGSYCPCYRQAAPFGSTVAWLGSWNLGGSSVFSMAEAGRIHGGHRTGNPWGLSFFALNFGNVRKPCFF